MFANYITYKDIADMWVHESFTAYSEALYIEYYFGQEAAAEYVIGTRRGIKNDNPIVGVYHVNKSGSPDMYSKGRNMLHTIRQIINNEDKWRMILRDVNTVFYHQTVEGHEIEKFITDKSGHDLSKVFDQYLRDTRVPTLEYRLSKNKFFYRWVDAVDGFNMPVKIILDNQNNQWLYPTKEWKSMKVKAKTASADQNFYIKATNRTQ